jgi:transposase-like protein
MTMARPPVFPVEEKFRIVLSILAGEVSVAEAARRVKVSEQQARTSQVSSGGGASKPRDHVDVV